MSALPDASRPRRWRAGLALAAVTALAVGGAVAVSAGARAAVAGCRVAYAVSGQWSDGFQGDVTITNLGDPVDGWRLVWTFPDSQRVTQAWNATVTSSGAQVTATNVSYNATIATNGTVSFGFLGTWSGSNPTPTSFALNGVTCTGGTTSPSSAVPSSVVPSSAVPSSAVPSSASPSVSPPADAAAAVAAMQPGWNMGNTLDAIGSDETAWGNPRITPQLLDTIRAQGFNSIRLPVTWSNHQGGAPDYTIEPVLMDRVREVVDWALADGFYVLLNLHHDSWQWLASMPTDHDGVLARYQATWTQIATAFRDEPAKLVFESVNEPQFDNTTDDQGSQLLNELNTTFHTIVRRSGGTNATRLLVLPPLGSSPDQARMDALAGTISSLNDRNLVATVHFYGFWPFSVNIAGYTRFNAETEQDMINAFERSYTTFVARGIPVIVGEYALLSYDYTRPGIIERGEVLKYFEAVGYQARIRKLTTMVWDAGSFMNRNTLQWRDPGLYALMRASWTTRSGTASSDQVFNRRSDAITSKTLTLNLNGTTFLGLRQGGTDLVDGSDYTVSGTQLTLTAAALTRLVGSRDYGVNAALQVRFSQGAPWPIDILSYDTPVLANATGATSAFPIPTQFRGDVLATMEARYADGSNAGPANWTSYKEFYSNFIPDPTTNTIMLTSTFFNEVNDGARVTLTFHFWSGATVTYHVTRSGSSVTGTTG